VRIHLVLAILTLLCSTGIAEQIRCPAPVTHIALDKGDYSPQSGVKFALSDFAANQVARGKASPLCFARMTDIQHGQVFIDAQSLTQEFSTKSRQSGSSVHDLRLEIKGNIVDIKGTVKKVIDIPFTLEGPVTTDGRVLMLHATSIKAGALPMKGLLDMLGKHLDSMLQSESIGGVRVNNDTIIFEPEKIAHVRGRIASADVKPEGLLVKFVPVEQKNENRPKGRLQQKAGK